jgi:GGDEF domain-containing protein
MARPSPRNERKLRWFSRLVLANCIAGTAVAATAIGPANWPAAALLSGSFWLAYALITIRIMRQQLTAAQRMIEYQSEVPESVDHETGLLNTRAFHDVVKREISRSLRYGDRTAIAVFDIRIVGFVPSKDEPQPPSPALYIKQTFDKSVRETDVVARLDLTHFAVLMTESDELGGQALISRMRTWLALEPYHRDATGKGIYVRAWAGAVAWQPEFVDAPMYLRAALDEMERTRPNYEAMQAEYAGTASMPTEGSRVLQRGA